MKRPPRPLKKLRVVAITSPDQSVSVAIATLTPDQEGRIWDLLAAGQDRENHGIDEFEINPHVVVGYRKLLRMLRDDYSLTPDILKEDAP